MTRLLAFVASDAFVRRRAVEQLAPAELTDAAVVHGLRRLLASDADVAVRALAAGALGSVRTASHDPAAPWPVPWLVDALQDESPVVRDAAIRALARHAPVAAYGRLCTLAHTDTTWWVRRAALYALGVIGTQAGADPIAPARAALTDPFWRVRHAAIQVLAIHGNRAPERRPEILADIEGGTAQYLSALWGPTLVEPTREPIPSRLPPALLDRDPAVVTARLAAMDEPPLAIVELLCDPHVPLRTLAAARLLEANDPAAFADALRWLDEPRIPHVAATVTTMLDSLGDGARDLAAQVLSAPARPGASRWAIGWVVATRFLDLAPLAWARAVELGASSAPDARIQAMAIAPASDLVDALRGGDVDLAIAAADELLARPSRVRREVLAALAPHASSAVRMRLAAAAGIEAGLTARGPRSHARGIGRDVAGAALEHDAANHVALERDAANLMALERDAAPKRDALFEREARVHLDAALCDRDPLARATALALLGPRLPAHARAEALADDDPAVRESVIAHATFDQLAAALETERDPWVRRAIARGLVRAIREDRRAPARERGAGGSGIATASAGAAEASGAASASAVADATIVRLATDADEWIRTLAVPYLDAAAPQHLRTIAALAADPSVMVQSAIVETLAAMSEDVLRAAAAATTTGVTTSDATTSDATVTDASTTDATRAASAIHAWLAAASADVSSLAVPSVAHDAPDVRGVRDTRGIDGDDALDVRGARGIDGDDALDVRGVRGARGIDGDDARDVRDVRGARGIDGDVVDARGANRAPVDPLAVPTLERRPFGSSGVLTSPLVISGAFDLQPGSLRVAAERGVTTYFWEPAYAGMTRFLRGKRERTRSQIVTGTYHADARSIEKDVDRALRRLRRDVIDVYLLFWSRSDARLDEQAFAVMDSLKRAGKVRAIGFSTHDRQLAMRALDRSPWDVVMTRHSAAHPGIEDGMLAHAKARGAGVLTFTALCYGRMLKGDGAPSAQDCYRYSIAQEGVAATISAPRRHRELVENLEVLDAGAMTEDTIARVRAHGAAVRVESQKFNALVRQPTRDAAAAAMAMLEEQLGPQGDRDEACVTPEALQRSLGSRGRGRASLPSAMLRRGRL